MSAADDGGIRAVRNVGAVTWHYVPTTRKGPLYEPSGSTLCGRRHLGFAIMMQANVPPGEPLCDVCRKAAGEDKREDE